MLPKLLRVLYILRRSPYLPMQKAGSMTARQYDARPGVTVAGIACLTGQSTQTKGDECEW